MDGLRLAASDRGILHIYLARSVLLAVRRCELFGLAALAETAEEI